MLKKVSIFLTAVIVVLVMPFASVWAPAAQAAEVEKPPIKVGIVYPISGTMASIAVPAYECHIQAMEEINKAGGILGGRKFEWITRDCKSNVELETRFVRELLIVEKVDVLHAGFGSSLGLAALAVVKEANRGVAFLMGGKTSRIRHQHFDRRVFCHEQLDYPEARGMARALCEYGLLKDIKNPRFYFLSWDYEYGHSLYNLLIPEIKKLKPGAKLVGETWTRIGETDYSPVLGLIKAKKPDALINFIWGGSLAPFLKQWKAYGLAGKIPVQYGESVGIEYADIHHLYPEGGWGMCQDYFNLPDNKEHRAYYERFKARWGHYPGAFGRNSYFATYMLAEALERAGTTDPKVLIPALETAEIETFVGTVWMRAINHQMQAGMYHVRLIKGGTGYPYARKPDPVSSFYILDAAADATKKEVLADRAKK